MRINIRGKLIDLSEPKIMGILNLTPDSFYDGGKYNEIKTALNQTEKMISQGAFFIDLGACSTRPGAKAISVDEEKKRLLPVLEKLIREFPTHCLLIHISNLTHLIICQCYIGSNPYNTSNICPC